MAGIVLLAGPGPSTWIVANALAGAHDDLTVIVEQRQSRTEMLRRRSKKLGLFTVAGQVLFQIWAQIGARRAMARNREIMANAGLDDTPLPSERFRTVASVNDAALATLLATARPDVVVVNGTRILSPALLSSIAVPVLNTHAGITPAYRGVHGGYWALARGDAARCGVTVHLVDAGVDTGEVIAQAPISPGPRDNFFTYPMLQTAAAIPLMLDAVRRAHNGRLQPMPVGGDSEQHYHPTLWGYVATGLRRGVW